MHSEVNSVYVSLPRSLFEASQSPKVLVVKSRGLSEMMAAEYRNASSKMQKRNREEMREGVRKREEGEELGEDAFILPTGNYPPNNTCISSTPVAHRLSSKGTREGGGGLCRASERSQRNEGDGQRREKGIINYAATSARKKNNGIIVKSMDYAIQRRGKAKSHSYTFFDIAHLLAVRDIHVLNPLSSSPLARVSSTRER